MSKLSESPIKKYIDNAQLLMETCTKDDREPNEHELQDIVYFLEKARRHLIG